MTRSLLLALLFLFVAATGTHANPSRGYPAELQQLHKNVWVDILNDPVNPETVQSLCNRMNEQGAWPGIDYASKQRGSWQPAEHLSNLQAMARAYQKPGSALFHD